MAEVLPEIQTFARIKVCGVGGGGSAAIERMIATGVQGIEFVAVNTDAQALHHSHATHKLHIGQTTTRGLGAGADPEVGRKAAQESAADIAKMLKGADMVFITLGAGGGTGTGAAPLIAQAAKEAGALVVAIATRPFSFEGERRRRNADAGIAALKGNVDTLITIPNDRILGMIDRKTSLLEAFKVVDEVLQQGVQGISNLITVHGLINLDFADIKSVMANAGSALMGIGRAKGDNRAVEAARQAIESPLLEVSVEGAQGVLFNITGGRNMSMHEIDEAAKTITEAVDPDANIIFGAVLDETMDDDIQITVVATGFDGVREPAPVVRRESSFDVPDPVLPSASRSPFFAADEDDDADEVEAPEPVSARPRVMNSGPFIDEPAEEEIEEAPARTGLFGRKRKADRDLTTPVPKVRSIEPDEDDKEDDRDLLRSTTSSQADRSEPVEAPRSTGKSLIERASKSVASSKPASKNMLDHEEDDLDIPAFIRRKVD